LAVLLGNKPALNVKARARYNSAFDHTLNKTAAFSITRPQKMHLEFLFAEISFQFKSGWCRDRKFILSANEYLTLHSIPGPLKPCTAL
jgi:hypothetical protein